MTWVFSAVMAAAPAPPATAKSFHVYPCFCRSSFSTPTAFDSPPEVHQCSTSTDSAACTADTPHIRPAAHRAPMIARNFIAYLLQTPEKKRMPVVGRGGVVGKKEKTGAVDRRPADACAWPAHRNPAAGR